MIQVCKYAEKYPYNQGSLERVHQSVVFFWGGGVLGSTAEVTQDTLNSRWCAATPISKIQIHRREDYGWVLWIFVEQRDPVPFSVYEILGQICYDATQQFPHLQSVQINELPMMPIKSVIRCAAQCALL